MNKIIYLVGEIFQKLSAPFIARFKWHGTMITSRKQLIGNHDHVEYHQIIKYY